MPGYSGTPLARKLGLKPGMSLVTHAAPPEYSDWLAPLPDGLELVRHGSQTAVSPEAVHAFFTHTDALEAFLTQLRPRLSQSGFVWISWPKKTARMDTDITEDVIRAVALPMGWVDIKVCAVSEIWSGLKLVIRRSERT